MDQTAESTYFSSDILGHSPWSGPRSAPLLEVESVREWTSCLKRGNRAENFDEHISYVRVDG